MRNKRGNGDGLMNKSHKMEDGGKGEWGSQGNVHALGSGHGDGTCPAGCSRIDHRQAGSCRILGPMSMEEICSAGPGSIRGIPPTQPHG